MVLQIFHAGFETDPKRRVDHELWLSFTFHSSCPNEFIDVVLHNGYAQ